MWTRSRQAMTGSLWLAAGAGTLAGCSDPSAPPVLSVAAVAATDGQTGVVGTALPVALRVQVLSDGAPKEGVAVHWHARSGGLAPIGGTSDHDGYAEATWTLGTAAGADSAAVTIDAAPGSVAWFSARATPGPAVAIERLSVLSQTLPVNHRGSSPLIAAATDQYANRITEQAITWSVESGPAVFLTLGGATDAEGRSISVIAPSGTTGVAVVRAALPGGGRSADFSVTIGPSAPWAISLANTDLGFAFLSGENGSRSPAVDTLPVGETVVWTLAQFDLDSHGVASVGTPSFQGGDFSYYGPWTITKTFTTAGTYRYTDPHHPEATGIVVVQ